MEAGASLVAFIGFELTSIKTIHHFVTSILDGPQRLQDLARALDSLRAAYERTQALQDLPGILESSPSLLKQLKQCNNDVVRYSKALEKMKIQPGERLHTALRKKFKIPLCEDEIKDMLSVFSRHVNSFMLEISILDMYVDTSSLVEGHITSRSRISQSNSSGISQVLTNNEYQSEMMHQNYTSLQKVQEDMFLSNLKIEHLQDGFDALALKVENLPAVTTQQSNMMLERFAKFERKFNELLLRERTMLDTTHRFVSAFDIAPAQKSNAESGNDRVVNSIRRLSSLLDEKDRVAEFDEAQDIIDEIETLLLQMETVIQHRKPGGLPIHRTEFCSVGKEHRKEMKRALGVLRCSPKLTLNPQSWSRHRPLAKRATRRKHDVALYQSQIGQWLVSTRRQWRICETEAGCEEHQEYTATIAFKPTARDGLHHIKVSVQQLQQANGFHTFTPVVSIGRIRPSESCVFQCVRSGLFDEFLWLLATGEASLQDRDEQGAPLLHYAYNQPKICNFLIKNGADVDKLAKVSHIIKSRFDPEKPVIPLYLAMFGSPSTFGCLLAAGADPTLRYSSDCGELRLEVANVGEDSEFEDLLSLGGTFFNVNDQSPAGITLMHISALRTKENKMKALIERGEDVNLRNLFGHNCLQSLVDVMWMERQSFIHDLDALGILLDAGADIFSRDKQGRSIWETANANRMQGSYARDVLDSALVSYGYHTEVFEFAEKVPRYGRYLNEYERYHFDLIWEGKEHLCPYYDEGEEIFEKDCDEMESNGNEEPWCVVSEESGSQQTKLNEAAEPVGGSPAGTADGVESRPGITAGFGSLGSRSRDHHKALGLNGPNEPLHVSVGYWLSTSRSQGEAELENASNRAHKRSGSLSFGFDAGHADDIFHNPWADG